MGTVALIWQHGGAIAWRNLAGTNGFGTGTVTGTACTKAVPWQVLVSW